MAAKPKSSTPEPTASPSPVRANKLSDGLDLMEWVQVNSRVLVGASAVVVVAALGYWFYVRSQQIKTINADRSLMQAEQSLQSGNAALATSDLQRVVSRYTGTGAGTQAALLLAQTNYNAGKYADGIKVLQEVSGKAGGSEAMIQSLIGDGHAQMGKNADAAKAYEKAADASIYPNEKSYYRAKAARSYSAAGNVADARRLWTELSTDTKSQSIAAEARVRLAELDAKRAGKS